MEMNVFRYGFLPLLCITLISVTTLDNNMSISWDSFLTIVSGLRFIAPGDLSSNTWQEIDTELKDKTRHVHFGLSNNILPPSEASEAYTEILSTYFKNKPEFIQQNAAPPGHTSHIPKTIKEAKSLKSSLRKRLKTGNEDANTRKLFAESIRYHNFLIKEKRKSDISHKQRNHEKQFKTNFWNFAKRACKGTLNDKPQKPSFTKEIADTYYPATYSQAPEFDPSGINWFPYLSESTVPLQFNSRPFKSKHIKDILA